MVYFTSNLIPSRAFSNMFAFCCISDGDLNHIKAMTELFNELTAVSDIISKERFILVYSLPNSNGPKANEDGPKMEMITERWLHTERKQKEK